VPFHFSGMRAGEIHATACHDVNFEAGTILLRDTNAQQNRLAYTPGVEAVAQADEGSPERSNFPSHWWRRQAAGSLPSTFERIVRERGRNVGYAVHGKSWTW